MLEYGFKLSHTQKKLRETEEPLRKATQEYIKKYLDEKWKDISVTKSGYYDGDMLRGLEYRILQEEKRTWYMYFLGDYIKDEEVVSLAVKEHDKSVG